MPQWRASIFPPLKLEVVSLRPVYIVRNFYHSLFLPSDDMGAVFISTILRKESTCLSEFRVTSETKTGYRNFICSACYAIFIQIPVCLPSHFLNNMGVLLKYALIFLVIHGILQKNNHGDFHGETQISHTATVGEGDAALCDIDDTNRLADKSKLHYKHDTPEMTAMIDAYNNRIPGTDYREAVAEACRICLAKITPPFQAIRYAEAMDRRDFIFDVLLEEAEFYLIGGGNG